MKDRFRNQKRWIAPLLAAIVISAVGEIATAGNMAFHLIKPIVFGGAGAVGDNWTSIPYLNPYSGPPCTTPAGTSCAGAFCTQTGLPALRATIADLNPINGATTTVTCGTATANTLVLTPGRGFKIRETKAGGVSSIAIFGSHDPSLSITIPKPGTGDIGNLWFSVPYHTTAVSAEDLCLQAGLASLQSTVSRVNAVNGATTTVTCGTATAGTLQLVLGEAVKLRDADPNGPRTFIPGHF